MPKQVDHEERRRHIIEALWQLAAREGLGTVSFRKVAAEADVSVRRIQYYFGTKAELLADALQALGEQVFSRGLQAIEKVGPDPSPRALLRATSEATLPTDAESSRDSLLFISFHVAGVTDPGLASDDAKAMLGWTVPFAVDVIERAKANGQTHPGVDPQQAARILMSAFYGLSLAVLAGTQSANEALDGIDYELDRIFI